MKIMKRHKNKKDKRKIVFSNRPKTKRLNHAIIKFVFTTMFCFNLPDLKPIDSLEKPKVLICY